MPTSHQFLKILGLSSVVFLTACGGDSDSESDSSTDSNSSSSFSNSLISAQRYFVANPDSKGVTKVSTILFSTSSSSNKTVSWGQGYIDSNDGSTYFIEKNDWSINSSGQLKVKDGDDGTGILKSSTDDYLVVCFYEDNNSSDCAGDDNNERWYRDKTQAKAYVKSSSTGGTSVDLNSITDSVLKAQFTALEFDYTEQVEEIIRNGASIGSVDGLEQFTHLTRLDLENNAISDISKLSALTKLERLSIHSNRITDISGLSSLINLERFYVGDQTNSTGDDVNLTSYTAIDSMPQLIELSLSEYADNAKPTPLDLKGFLNNVSTDKSKIERLEFLGLQLDNDDVTAISGMPNLQALLIADGDISDFTLWNNSWANLEELAIGWNNEDATTPKLPSFDFDEMINDGLGLSKLKRFEVAYTAFSDDDLKTLIDGVGANLKYIDLRSTNITDYAYFDNANIKNLERLKLRVTGQTYDLEDWSFTDTSKFKHLYMEDGTISNFDLSEFESLQKLQITGSNISDMTISEFVTALNKLSDLTSLVIRSPGSRSTRVKGSQVTCNSLTDLSSSISCRD